VLRWRHPPDGLRRAKIEGAQAVAVDVFVDPVVVEQHALLLDRVDAGALVLVADPVDLRLVQVGVPKVTLTVIGGPKAISPAITGPAAGWRDALDSLRRTAGLRPTNYRPQHTSVSVISIP
jgi:hypothetical protein